MKYLNIFAVLLISALSLTSASCSNEKPSKTTPNKTKDKPVEIKKNKKKILFYGNSITAAYGLDPSDAFSSIIQRRIDSLNMDYTCVNAGNSGETTKGGISRLDWVLKEPVDIFVLELGANDGLRGYDVTESKANLITIIQKVKTKYPDAKILLAGMKVPPSMGEEYFLNFEKIYEEIAQEQEVALIPFLLDKVAGEPDLNLPDGIHPTEEGHKILAETVWKHLQPLL